MERANNNADALLFTSKVCAKTPQTLESHRRIRLREILLARLRAKRFDMEVNMEFNEKLQELRKGKKLTQEELAQDLFVSRTAISKWESGRGYPSIDSLKEISRYFSVSIDELICPQEIISAA